MIDLDYAAMRGASIGQDPYAHILVPGFVPPAALTRVLQGMPGLQSGGSFPIDALTLGAAARDLMAALAGPLFRDIVADRFDLELQDAPVMITLRGQSREKDGRIHRDSAAKRVTVLLYLNPTSDSWVRQEGCLRLLRAADDLESYAVEVPPTDGTLLVFPNGPTTWHGHKQFVGRRYVVQLNYMTNDSAARAELRRHRLSAFVKRLAS